MDTPRDPVEVGRERRRRRLRRAVPFIAAALVIFVGLRLLLGGRGEGPASAGAPVPLALPDSVWAARVYELADGAPPLNSLIVARRDTILYEWYFRGMRADRDVNVKSVSKSIMSTLIGIALHRGEIDSLGQRVAEFLPTYFAREDEPQKLGLTLKDLITMTTGLEGTSFENYDPWIASRDWIRYALDQPILAPPGRQMDYSTGNSHMLSAILTEASGVSTLTYARRYLFGPLGADIPAWDRSPEGYYLGGNNMSLTPREMLAVGRLYLNRGTYRGRRILDASWVDRSFEVLTHSPHTGAGYGYGWWTRTLAGTDVHYALGYGGQFIFVIPDLETVVVATSEIGSGRRRRRSAYSVISRGVIPAIRDLIRNRDSMLQEVRAAGDPGS